MSNQIVPNTNDLNVAALAVAWEIVSNSMRSAITNDSEANIKTLTNAVIKVQAALVKREPLAEK